MTIPAPQGLDGIVGSPPWVAMVGAVEAAEKQERADELVEGLLRRIANRRDMLGQQASEETY